MCLAPSRRRSHQCPAYRRAWSSRVPWSRASGDQCHRSRYRRSSLTSHRSHDMKWTRRFYALGLALVLSATVSCSTDSPTSPAVETDDQQAYLLSNLFEGDRLLSDGGLLSSDGLV